MSNPTAPGSLFRHVVFPAERKRQTKVVNLAGAPEPAGERLALSSIGGLGEESAEFLKVLFTRAGLDVENYRTETLVRRLPACLRSLRVRALSQARALIDDSPDAVSTALDAMLVGVSWFFRDSQVFDYLRSMALPMLLQPRPAISVWSVGCSDGAELISVALLLAEQDRLPGCHLLGTDCRTQAIRRARLGCFDADAMRHVPARLLRTYFSQRGPVFEVLPAMRTSLHWRVADLCTTLEPGAWDLILCRNTTMYLRPDAAQRVFQQLESLLRPGGILVLGRAERPAGARRFLQVGPCVYRRNY